MWIIDEALAKMNAELSIDLPKKRPSGRQVDEPGTVAVFAVEKIFLTSSG
jgi:hypothetical protein